MRVPKRTRSEEAGQFEVSSAVGTPKEPKESKRKEPSFSRCDGSSPNLLATKLENGSADLCVVPVYGPSVYECVRDDQIDKKTGAVAQ